MTLFRTVSAALLIATAAPSPVRAAESFDACRGFITTLPAVIGEQGVWCLDRDLATNSASGAAIVLANNNITIDCNGYKIGGLSAGINTEAAGIRAVGRSNITVRGCTLRGFMNGIEISGAGGSGHLVAGNRIEGSTLTGIWLEGRAVRVTDNDIIDTGGAPNSNYIVAVQLASAQGSVDGNRISGVLGSRQWTSVVGVGVLQSQDVVVENNDITHLGPQGTSYGIHAVASERLIAVGNRMLGGTTTLEGRGIWSSSSQAICVDNLSESFPKLRYLCIDGGGNYPAE